MILTEDFIGSLDTLPLGSCWTIIVTKAYTFSDLVTDFLHFNGGKKTHDTFCLCDRKGQL